MAIVDAASEPAHLLDLALVGPHVVFRGLKAGPAGFPDNATRSVPAPPVRRVPHGWAAYVPDVASQAPTSSAPST
jgi:hypothetical protein